MEEEFEHGFHRLRVAISRVGHNAEYRALKFDERTTFFAVYDGETGKNVPAFCAKYLHEEISRIELVLTSENGGKEDPECLILRSAIEQALIGLEQMLEQEDLWTQLDEGSREYENMHDVASLDDAGSMICVVIVRDNHVITGNAGRCLCVISRKHQPFVVTTEHTCEIWAEKKRAKDALKNAEEGSASDMSLADVAAPGFTRALGYRRYKKIYEVSAEEQIVIAKPEVKIVKLRGDIQFLILATGGFWAKVDIGEVVASVNESITADVTLSEACNKLQKAYHSKGGKMRGNMVVMIIRLSDVALPPKGNNQTEEKPVELRCHNVSHCAKELDKWKLYSKTYILARDKDQAELRELLRVATLTSIVYGNDLGPKLGCHHVVIAV